VNTDQTANTITMDLVSFAINTGAAATTTGNVYLTNLVCPSGSQIARGNTINPTNWASCGSSLSHSLTEND
jgi:hypothetical protein